MLKILLIFVLVFSFSARQAFALVSNVSHTHKRQTKEVADYAVFATSYRPPIHSESERQIYTGSYLLMPIRAKFYAVGFT